MLVLGSELCSLKKHKFKHDPKNDAKYWMQIGKNMFNQDFTLIANGLHVLENFLSFSQLKFLH